MLRLFVLLTILLSFLFSFLAPPPPDPSVRVATYNISLNRNVEGGLRADLAAGNAQARTIAEVVQRTRPDVLLLNEFDYDPVALQIFVRDYLAVGQGGAEPIDYGYTFTAPVNTGVPSGLDLDNSGSVGGPNDAFGFGFFPGQYGMAVLSRFPIDTEAVRTFQNFRWQDMPGNRIPTDYYSPAAVDALRLSSKSHWDVPIDVAGRTLHFLVSHPTPPVFDGPEDRNGRRNADEIRFWADYLHPEKAGYIYDDAGARGGLADGAPFVIAGDQNSDPADGDSLPGAAQQLLDDPAVNTTVTPASDGAVEQAQLQGGVNLTHRTPAKFDTADFAEPPGNIRADYVLPRSTMTIRDAGVFWPTTDSPQYPLVGTYDPKYNVPAYGNNGFASSDHKLVWIEVTVPRS